jgi:energy-coupling factor transporter ATP-binding protein EcfA2
VTAPVGGGLRIKRLAAQNFKRLVAIDITTPDDDVVVISGENGAGKSTVFDAIAALFGGADEIDAEPLRRGQDSGFIKAAIGGEEVELVVKRYFKRGKDKVKSEVTVTTAKGFTPPGGPQAVLDGLYGALSFDAMAFDRMKPKEQLAELLRVFPIGVDLDEIAALNKTDYARRTDINRDAKAARVKAQAITVVPNLPEERIDESALIGELQAAGETNAAIETRKARRADTAADVDRLRVIATNARKQVDDLRRRAEAAEQEESDAIAKAAELMRKLEEAEPLPEPVDATAIRAKIDDARKVNAAIEWRENRLRLEAQADELDANSNALTAAMEAREKAKVDAIAAAELPVPGLGFDENGVTFDGFPFDQAASSDRLVTSVAIGMAASPQLRVILVRDASLLTAKNRERIKALAKGKRYQVWEEIATEEGEGIGIVIEEGAVKGSKVPS